MNGKRTCSLLKSIRCKIAEQNEIEFHTPECTFEGECKGTCPKCEAELRYLTQKLEKLRASGRRVAVAGIATAVMASSLSGCARPSEDFDFSAFENVEYKPETKPQLSGQVLAPQDEKEETEIRDPINGDVAYPEEEESGELLTGKAAPEETPAETPEEEKPKDNELVLEGDVYFPETEESEEVLAGIMAAPVTFFEVAEMTEEEAKRALDATFFEDLHDSWQEHLIFLEEEERRATYSVENVTVVLRYDQDGMISDVSLTEEPGENADE